MEARTRFIDSRRARLEEELRKLENLGAADKIAEYLKNEGVKGFPCGIGNCAISNFLIRKLTSIERGSSVSFDYLAKRVEVESGGIGLRIEAPNLAEFARKFDSKGYPDLIKGGKT